MPANYNVHTFELSVVYRSPGDFTSEPEPSLAPALKEARYLLSPLSKLLRVKIKRSSDFADKNVLIKEAVPLMAVNGKYLFTGMLPFVFFVSGNTNKNRDYFGKSFVMIAFDPHDLDVLLGVRYFADVGEEFPVRAAETFKINIVEDIAIQDKPVEAEAFEDFDETFCTAYR